jgi:hypothetical protein
MGSEIPLPNWALDAFRLRDIAICDRSTPSRINPPLSADKINQS